MSDRKRIIIEVSEELHQAWPQFQGAAVFATVKNSAYSEALWAKIEEFTTLYFHGMHIRITSPRFLI